MKLHSLMDLLADEIRDLYSAENQMVKGLPKMVKAASSPELQKAFQEHLEQTKGHVDRLERVCDNLDLNPTGKRCKAMEGLLEEAREYMQEEAEPPVLDAALIAAAQRVEHYEIAGYGCARTFATLLGHRAVAKLLQETLDEEGEADKKLTHIAEAAINAEAAQFQH